MKESKKKNSMVELLDEKTDVEEQNCIEEIFFVLHAIYFYFFFRIEKH